MAGEASDRNTGNAESLRSEQAHWLDPAVIQAHLRTAGDGVPDPLRDQVFGRVILSAEGVTTFAGYAGNDAARARVKAKLSDPHANRLSVSSEGGEPVSENWE